MFKTKYTFVNKAPLKDTIFQTTEQSSVTGTIKEVWSVAILAYILNLFHDSVQRSETWNSNVMQCIQKDSSRVTDGKRSVGTREFA